jgi:hypothetical protein
VIFLFVPSQYFQICTHYSVPACINATPWRNKWTWEQLLYINVELVNFYCCKIVKVTKFIKQNLHFAVTSEKHPSSRRSPQITHQNIICPILVVPDSTPNALNPVTCVLSAPVLLLQSPQWVLLFLLLTLVPLPCHLTFSSFQTDETVFSVCKAEIN